MSWNEDSSTSSPQAKRAKFDRKSVSMARADDDNDEDKNLRDANALEESKNERKVEKEEQQKEFDPRMDPFNYNTRTKPAEVPVELLPQFCKMLTSGDVRTVLQGVLMVRKVLAVNENPPIAEVLKHNPVPDLISLLTNPLDDQQIIFNACWALSNIASDVTGEGTKVVIECGAVPPLISLLNNSTNDEVLDQATWAIGNLAGESAQIRDLLLQQNAMPALIQCINKPASKITIPRHCAWAMSNLCRHRPQPEINAVAVALPVFVALVIGHPDQEVKLDALWAISYIGEGSPERIQHVINSGIITNLVGYLSATHAGSLFQVPATRIFGNLACGTPSQNSLIFSAGAMPHFLELLNNPSTKRTVRREIIWMVSNLLVGDEAQIEQVIQSGVVFPILVQGLVAVDAPIRKESLMAARSLIERGSTAQIKGVLDHLNKNYTDGIWVKNMIRLLTDTYSEVIVTAIETLGFFLQYGDEELGIDVATRQNEILVQCKALDVADILRQLVNHPDEKIRELAEELGYEYFGFGDQDVDENDNNSGAGVRGADQRVSDD